jgi:hypothetical protein
MQLGNKIGVVGTQFEPRQFLVLCITSVIHGTFEQNKRLMREELKADAIKKKVLV